MLIIAIYPVVSFVGSLVPMIDVHKNTILKYVKVFKLDSFRMIHDDLFWLKWGVCAGLVDTALTRAEIKKCK